MTKFSNIVVMTSEDVREPVKQYIHYIQIHRDCGR
jgi:hypothetical protein